MSGCAAAIRICLPPSLTQGTSVPSRLDILRSLSAASAIEMPPP